MKIKVKIDATTPMAALECFSLSTEQQRALMQAGRRRYAHGGDWWQMTAGEFLSMCRGEVSDRLKAEADTAFAHFAVLDFGEFVKMLTEMLERLTPPLTAEERQAAKALPKQTTEEVLLIFIRQYFGLKSFAEAESVPMLDFLIAKKDVYAKAKYEREVTRLRRYVKR